MKRFRYEAVDSSGTPVFGVEHCDHLADLNRILKDRGQTVRNYVELSLEEFNRKQSASLPRLFQLRVGERIQDALLTGLPAHEAVRAVAAEPVQSPFLFAMPWVYLMAAVSLLFVYGSVPLGMVSLWTANLIAVLLIGCIPLAHWAVREFLHQRPRRILLRVADRLEKGFEFRDVAGQFLPREMQALLSSDLKDETKARATSEIMPAVLVRSTHLQRLAMVLIAPIALFVLINLMLCATAMIGIPLFSEIFDGFGITLPALTAMAMSLGNALQSLGWSGLAILAVACVTTLAFMAFVVGSGWGHEMMSGIPGLGTIFTWSMQARVCRMMSTLCRNGATNAETVKTATSISGFRSVELRGQYVVDSIQKGDANWPVSGPLTGLPISMLKGVDGEGSSEERRAGLATTFQHLGEMLEQASLTQATALAGLLRLGVYAYTIFIVFLIPSALILPMIKLLNDLS